ncbi:Succinyl-CoA:(R)-benzylsuccinate CoA-transferase subunit BbsF (plasmid) [Variovorax sp. SRS16]|nr:Succinyl-CoA:(R)-benzylsuccinate CoA-transferase subunit BbsF [Variovorax sp. SRS16]
MNGAMSTAQPAQPRKPALAGVRILDLSRVLAGPWCTMTLADLGADVIKIENPAGGDDTRGWGPPNVGGESAYFFCANRNKRSVAVDISQPEGQALVRELLAHCDVVVENFRAGALQRYGLDYDSLSASRPDLIYCSISGYGRSSPLADRAGYDYIMQAEGGLMSITGEAEGEPMKVGVAVADLFTGMYAVQAILAAIIARRNDGLGQRIDMALFDCQLTMLANVGSSYLVSGKEPVRYGNGHPAVVPYQVFPTRDAEIVIAVGNDRQFRLFCEQVLERPDIVADVRFTANADRARHRDALVPLLSDILRTQDAAHWQARLATTGIPTGRVRTVGAALESPEAQARGMVSEVEHPTAGSIRLVSSPLRMSGTPVRTPSPPPTLGQHTDEVLAEIGWPTRERSQPKVV